MFINATSCIRAAAVHLLLLAVSVSSFCLDNDAVLALANEFRLGHSSSPLVWNSSIAQSAQAHARWLAANSCRLTHSTGYELGETLYQESYTPARTEPQSCLAAVMSWYNEVYNYRFTDAPWTDNQDSIQDVGGFTQLVWASTSEMGCGIAQAADYSCHVVVCQYYVPGNVADDAQWLHNVLPIMEVSEESSSESSPSLLDAWAMSQNSVTATESSSRTLPANASHGGAPPSDSLAPAEESSEESSLKSSGDETAESAADASHEQMAGQQASARQSSPSRRAGRRHLKERRLRTVTRE
ncbi:CAP domain-containing protein [Haematococcus lacustris]